MTVPELITLILALPCAIASILDITKQLKESTRKERDKPETQEHADKDKNPLATKKMDSQQVRDTCNTERERSPHPSLSRRITRGIAFRKRDHVTM